MKSGNNLIIELVKRLQWIYVPKSCHTSPRIRLTQIDKLQKELCQLDTSMETNKVLFERNAYDVKMIATTTSKQVIDERKFKSRITR